MARVRQGDLVIELADLCRAVSLDLRQRLAYYLASAYKADAARQINLRVDHLRAIFQIIGDDALNESMADHDAILDQGAQLLAAGECTLTARLSILLGQMEPALSTLVRRAHQAQGVLRDDTLKILQRHRHTLLAICPEGSRSREILRDL